MDDHSIQLVKDSVDLLEPIAPQAAARFYSHLFAADPSLQALFYSDMAAQGRQLMQMMSLAISHLHEPELLIPTLQKLGQHSAGDGLRDAHYDLIRAALLKTLRQVLGVAFTPEVDDAWMQAYNLVTETMKEAANRPSMVSSWATI